MRWQKILCPVDFSASSRHAFECALDLAREHGATVTLAHVFAGPGRHTAEVHIHGELITQMADSARADLETWKREAGPGVEIATTLVFGVPWDQIVNLVRDDHFDLVVLHTHGVSGLAHMLMGSTSERVVRHVSCPVLVLRQRDA